MNGEELYQNYSAKDKAYLLQQRANTVSSKYRIKRPFSMISNSSNLSTEVLNSHSHKKQKFHSNTGEVTNSFSSESMKNSPVFSMNRSKAYNPHDVEMLAGSSANNNVSYSQINESKR
jgi:hypothetical protein